jgi:hypothetical protein
VTQIRVTAYEIVEKDESRSFCKRNYTVDLFPLEEVGRR